MKTLFFIFFTLTIVSFLLSDSAITRGPDIGEIYFVGPVTSDDYGIYHSTDFGEPATCMDSSYDYYQIEYISADLTPGSVYSIIQYNSLYYSNNFGQNGSWEFKNYPIWGISSGRNEGTIYNTIESHSNDYGVNFIQHQLNGYFGAAIAYEIDNSTDLGYVIIYDNEPDSIYFLISNDDFDNLEIQHVFGMHWDTEMDLSRGFENGELFLLSNSYSDGFGKELRYSNDYGNSWELKNTFNCPNLPIKGIVGGRQPGELYMITEYLQSMRTICHTYIYHSLDYGETFEIFHPISIGDDPHFADFEAAPTAGPLPLTVQFTDLSGGDPNGIIGWQWDFDGDGEFDSYEQHPEYTYQDSGLYSVTLYLMTVGGIGDEAIAFRKDYIHVTAGNDVENYELEGTNYELNNYPNPFNPLTIINYELPTNTEKANIEIYNIKGQIVDNLKIYNEYNSVEWNAESFPSGIYFYKLDLKNSPVNKMILLK